MLKTAPSKTYAKEETRARHARDLRDEEVILQVMKTYSLGSANVSCTVASNVATKDIAATLKHRGVELVKKFVRQKLASLQLATIQQYIRTRHLL